MERILHSDIEAFEHLREKTTERFTDIGRSLVFFNYTVPDIISSFYKLFLEGKELWKHRSRIDELSLLYPLGVYVFRIGTTWLHSRLMNEYVDNVVKLEFPYFDYFGILPKHRKKKKERNLKTTEFVSNLTDGLADIQINNLQQSQLDRLDDLIGKFSLAEGGKLLVSVR